MINIIDTFCVQPVLGSELIGVALSVAIKSTVGDRYTVGVVVNLPDKVADWLAVDDIDGKIVDEGDAVTVGVSITCDVVGDTPAIKSNSRLYVRLDARTLEV